MDDILVSDGVIRHERETEVHDELLHDESVAQPWTPRTRKATRPPWWRPST